MMSGLWRYTSSARREALSALPMLSQLTSMQRSLFLRRIDEVTGDVAIGEGLGPSRELSAVTLSSTLKEIESQNSTTLANREDEKLGRPQLQQIQVVCELFRPS